jgi:hypothetical protein
MRKKCSYGTPLSKDGMRMGINGRIYQILQFKEEVHDTFDFGEKDYIISGLLNGKPFEYKVHTCAIGEPNEDGGWDMYDSPEDYNGKFDVFEEDVASVWDWMSDLCYDLIKGQETEYEVEEM